MGIRVPASLCCWAPHRIGCRLPQSRVSKVIIRFRMPLLGHIDVKKLGRIPDGGGWRTLGETAGRKNRRASVRTGNAYLPSTIADHSRVTYSEIFGDEKQSTETEFRKRANSYYEPLGIIIDRVHNVNRQEHLVHPCDGRPLHPRRRRTCGTAGLLALGTCEAVRVSQKKEYHSMVSSPHFSHTWGASWSVHGTEVVTSRQQYGELSAASA